MLPFLAAALTILVTWVAIYMDIRYSKVFNFLTVPTMMLGLVINGANEGWVGLAASLAGIFLGICVFLLTSALFGRILGGGDIKLLMAIGALQGPVFLGWALLYTALIGGALAILLGIWRGVLMQRLRSLTADLYLRVDQGVPMDIDQAEGKLRLPYAIPISLGTICVLWRLHGG